MMEEEVSRMKATRDPDASQMPRIQWYKNAVDARMVVSIYMYCICACTPSSSKNTSYRLRAMGIFSPDLLMPTFQRHQKCISQLVSSYSMSSYQTP